MLAFNVQFGESFELEHQTLGALGNFRVERRGAGAGAGTGVRILFNMPRVINIKVLRHRDNGITFGLTGQSQGHLKVAAI